MKTLKNGNIAFYRLDRMVIPIACTMGLIMAALVLYFTIQNKQVLYIVIPILFFMMIIESLVIIKFVLPPVLIASPQGIESKKGNTIFWDQITGVYRQKGLNSTEQLFFETTEGAACTVSLRLVSNEDQEYIFKVLKEHNLSIQERCL